MDRALSEVKRPVSIGWSLFKPSFTTLPSTSAKDHISCLHCQFGSDCALNTTTHRTHSLPIYSCQSGPASALLVLNPRFAASSQSILNNNPSPTNSSCLKHAESIQPDHTHTLPLSRQKHHESTPNSSCPPRTLLIHSLDPPSHPFKPRPARRTRPSRATAAPRVLPHRLLHRLLPCHRPPRHIPNIRPASDR
jgi:hypothetical protein